MTEDAFKRMRRDALAGEGNAENVLYLCEVIDKLRKALSEAHQANGELRAQVSEMQVDYDSRVMRVERAL
jgi:hypothetical protein